MAKNQVLSGVVCSDFHLGGMNRVLPDPTAWQMRELHKPFKYALSKGIPNVFIPGDASDSPVMSERDFIAFVTLILTYDQSLNITYILGNHDVHSKEKASMDVLRLFHDNQTFKNFRLVYATEQEDVDGVNVVYVPYPDCVVPEPEKRGRPPLVFAHTETPGAIGDNGYPLKTREDHLKRVPGDFVISGHIHKYQHLRKQRWIYCGSPYQKNFGEDLPKGFIEFQASYEQGKLSVNHQFVNSKPGFVLETVNIESEDDWGSLVEDPARRYKIQVDRGIRIPKDLTTRFPNIVQVNNQMAGRGNTGTDQEGEVVKARPAEITTTVKTGLGQWLKSSGLDRRQRDMARGMVDDAIKSGVLDEQPV